MRGILGWPVCLDLFSNSEIGHALYFLLLSSQSIQDSFFFGMKKALSGPSLVSSAGDAG